MKANVLLIVPRYFSTDTCGYIMPLGILYVSSALKKSKVANVYTINLNHHNDSEKALKEIILNNSIDIVGTSGLSGQFIEVYPLLRMIKKIKPSIITIVGGGMITADPIPAMEAFDSLADFGVIGEGEISVPELINAINLNLNKESINGIIYNKNGQWIITKRRDDIEDLDSIPFPDYEGFDYDKYLDTNGEIENGTKYSPVAIIGGRSCKYNCTFCFHPSGSKYRQRSLDSIFSEIDYLVSHYKVNYIALREELFSSNITRVVEFCERMRPYPLVWSIQLRVDCINDEIVNALANSNCRYIFLGIESADNRILKSMRKKITIEQVEYALNLTIKAGLDTRSTIIFGDSEESMETANNTIKWWLKNRKMSSIALDMIIAFPGSTIYNVARKNGRIPDPVKFLKDGCPIINLSSNMTDREYAELVSQISKYNGICYNIHNYKDL